MSAFTKHSRRTNVEFINIVNEKKKRDIFELGVLHYIPHAKWHLNQAHCTYNIQALAAKQASPELPRKQKQKQQD